MNVKNAKYKDFLTDLTNQHKNGNIFFETVISAYNIIFEAAEANIQVEDSSEADQLSAIVKNIDNIKKEEQNEIYRKFIEIDINKIFPQQTLSDIFNKLKMMLIKLTQNQIKLTDIINFLEKYK